MPTMVTTAPTPMMRPSAVNVERNLFRESARRATLMMTNVFMARQGSDYDYCCCHCSFAWCESRTGPLNAVLSRLVPRFDQDSKIKINYGVRRLSEVVAH